LNYKAIETGTHNIKPKDCGIKRNLFFVLFRFEKRSLIKPLKRSYHCPAPGRHSYYLERFGELIKIDRCPK